MSANRSGPLRPRSPHRRPRVLYLTHHLPYPPNSGGRLREYELLTRLSGRVDLHLVAATKTFEQDVPSRPALEEHCQRLELFATDPPSGPRTPQVERHRSPAMTRRVAELLASEPFDVLHLEGFYMWQHLALARQRPPTILVEHNVEYELWRQRAAHAGSRETAERMSARADATRSDEIAAWHGSEVLAAVTDDDRRQIEKEVGRDVELVPDGVDHIVLGRGQASRNGRPTIAMVGNFAYEPNVDAALWMCARILPAVLESTPAARLRIVGAAPPPEVERLAAHPAVEVTGYVPDVKTHLDSADVVVCPLRIGGGVKVKILEALARGKAIVTTEVGAQGLGPDAADAMRIADRPADFATATCELLRDRARRAELERRAFHFVRTLPTWDEAAAELEEVYRRARELRQPSLEELALWDTDRLTGQSARVGEGHAGRSSSAQLDRRQGSKS
jgi:polysaccharide biosynthesis protein PslH